MFATLRLILVYGGSCAGALWLANRFVRPLSARAGAGLLLLPLLLTGRAVFTGGYYGPLNLAYSSAPLVAKSPPIIRQGYKDGILSDLQIQMVPWRKAVRELVKTGHLPFWNRFSNNGDPLLGISQPAPFHPVTFLGFLLPLATAWTFGCAFTLFLAGLFCYFFLSDLGLEPGPSFLAASVWCLSGFIVFNCGWPLGSAFSTLPLLTLGLRRIALGLSGGFRISVAAWVLLLVAGHPESILHVTTGAGIVFLFAWARARLRLRALFRAAAAGLMAAAISGPALLPFLDALPQTFDAAMRASLYAHQKKSLALPAVARAALGAVYPWTYGTIWNPQRVGPPNFFEATWAFVGGAALCLALLGLFSRRREKWIFAALVLFPFSIAVGVPGVTDVVSRLPLFRIALNGRLTGVAAFGLAVLAGLGVERVGSGFRKREIWVPGALVAALAVAGLWRRRAVLRMNLDPVAFDRSVALLVAAAALVIAVGSLGRGRPRLVCAAILGLFLTTHLAELRPLYPTFPAELFYPSVPEFAGLPRGGEPYRVAGVGFALVPNQSALYELEDPRAYGPMMNIRLMTTFQLWCVPQPVWFNRIDDLTRPFLSFLNVRFAIADPGAPVPWGWQELVRGKDCSIFENPEALPRAFAPRRIRFVPNWDHTVEEMKSCDDFSKVGWIERPGKPASEELNGQARVSVWEEGPDLVLDIDARSRAWIVSSETNWRGWEAFCDGRRIAVFFANQAFLGFSVPAGHHRLRLLYRPASFLLGLLTGGAALLLAVGAFAARRLRRGAP